MGIPRRIILCPGATLIYATPLGMLAVLEDTRIVSMLLEQAIEFSATKMGFIAPGGIGHYYVISPEMSTERTGIRRSFYCLVFSVECSRL